MTTFVTTTTLDPALLFENGKAASLVSPGGSLDYYNVGNGAHWEWNTSARYMEVDCYVTSSFAVGVGNPTRLGVRLTIAGVIKDLWYTIPQTANAGYTGKFWLPKGSKNVQLFVPPQFNTSAGAAPKGVYPRVVRFDAAATAVSPTLKATHLVIYGDSIPSGGVGVCPGEFGYPALMRKGVANGGYAGSVTLVSWGGRRINDDCNTSGAATAFVTALLALQPTKILVAIGSNDQAVIPGITVANFTTYYGRLLDEIHSQSPSMPIVCFSPILRQNPEVNNANSENLTQFRLAISTLVSARSAWSVPPTYLEGSTVLTMPTDYGIDLIHPSTAGNIKMRDAVLAAV